MNSNDVDQSSNTPVASNKISSTPPYSSPGAPLSSEAPPSSNNQTQPQQNQPPPSSNYAQEVQSPSRTETQTQLHCNERGSPNKKGLTSGAWEHFKRQKIDDKWKAICKYCEKRLGGDTKAGATHLHDHIKTCKLRTVKGPRQAKLSTMPQVTSSGGDGIESTVTGNFNFNQDISRVELAKMVVLHEYPLAMVDHIGFRKFCSTLQPLWKHLSRNTIKSDIMNLYESERLKIAKVLGKISSRIAITTDMWTASNQNKGYMTVTVHFIDDAWILQSRLISDSDKEMRKVKKLFEDLITEYQVRERRRSVPTSSDSTTSSTVTSSSFSRSSKWKTNYFQFVQDTSGDDQVKSELDCYLEEPVMFDKSIEESFDILGYWKNIGVKYPTLQKIARDFLAIPISTVASESAFSTGGRVLSPQRSRLNPNTIEALMCTQDWLRSSIYVSSKGKTIPQCLTVLEDKDVEDMGNLQIN